MSTLEYVELAAARAARGVRLVVSGLVPSPWSQAAKGLFRVAGVPVLAVRAAREDPELRAWTSSHNVPVVLHDDEPPRTSWSDIVMLADGLAPGVLLAPEIDRRMRTIALLHELAGERGLGWNARLLMIEAGLHGEGERGFPRPVAHYLAGKYGHAPERVAVARARGRAQLAALERELGAREFFGDAGPDALDVYVACFLTILEPLSEADCPRMAPALRRAFLVAHEELGDAVGASLVAHQRRMRAVLGWPIAL